MYMMVSLTKIDERNLQENMGTYSLVALPYYRYHKHVQHDGMHTIKDVMEHIIDWLIGIPNEASLSNAENELQPTKRIRSDMMITLKKSEKERCNERCRNLFFRGGIPASREMYSQSQNMY